MVEPILVVVAVIAVPWMLFVKPFYLKKQAAKTKDIGGVTFTKLEASNDIHNGKSVFLLLVKMYFMNFLYIWLKLMNH